MALTLAQLRDRIRRQVGDLTYLRWNDSEIEDAIKDAMLDCWPYFFEHVVDEASYVGVNALALNTQEIAIPSAFFAFGERAGGQITRIECRMTDGSSSSSSSTDEGWFKLSKGIRVDSADDTAFTPRIRFNDALSSQCELKIYGVRPVTPPTRWDFTALATTDVFTATSDVTSSETFVAGRAVSLAGTQHSAAGLPTGVTINTRYYMVNVAGLTFKLALNPGGTPIDLATNGAGTFFTINAGITATDWEGFITYLTLASQVYLHQSRHKGNQVDSQGNSQRRLIAGQDVTEIKKRYRMRAVGRTLFGGW